MVIHDLDHLEEVEEKTETEVVGGNFNFFSFLRNLIIHPVSSAGINTLGGDSIGNSVTSYNISMPIFIFMPTTRNSRRSRWSSFFF